MTPLDQLRRGKRAVLLLVAGAFVLLSVALVALGGSGEPLPWIWPLLMATGAAGCMYLAVRPEWQIWRWTGTVLVVSLASRPVALAAALATDRFNGRGVWSALVASVVYGLAAWGVHRAWRYDLGPWVRAEDPTGVVRSG